MNTRSLLRNLGPCVAAAFATYAANGQVTLRHDASVSLPGGGEIVAYTKYNYTLATTYFTGSGPSAVQGVNLYGLTGGGASYRATVDLAPVFGPANTYSVSSVALDPLGRGFGVATVIPAANTTVTSKLAFFDYTSGALLHTVDVGYHADSVTFARDGSRIVVANEGEANPGTAAPNDGSDAAGSVSVISLSGISSAAQVSGVAVQTIDFSAANLGAGASLTGVRNPYIPAVGNPGNSAAQQTFVSAVPNFSAAANINHVGIEPEYVVAHGNKVYASLQENNAIGVLDTTTGKWENIFRLGTITQTIDASDSNSAALINQPVAGLPMPDTIGVVEIGGTTYIVTANEGDARIDDRDATRFGDVSGGDSLNPVLDPSLPTTQTGVRANNQLGRLNVSRIDGDTDGDCDIDSPVMFGTRSFSIWNASTGLLVADSGNLEAQLLALDPARFNINRENLTIDNRSDDKGPEPEALSVFTLGSQTFVAVGLERQNGILLYDISNPAAPKYLDYINGLEHALISPESLLYVAAEDSPTGSALLLAGFEGVDGTGANAGIGIYSIAPIPEPSTYAAAGVATLIGLAAWRRRR
jgi:hypothetical protein